MKCGEGGDDGGGGGDGGKGIMCCTVLTVCVASMIAEFKFFISNQSSIVTIMFAAASTSSSSTTVPPPPPSRSVKPLISRVESIGKYVWAHMYGPQRQGSTFHIHQEEFEQQTFYARLDDCRVVARVSFYDTPTDGQAAPAQELVYIALWFDQVFFHVVDPPWRRVANTKWSHHITLAYAPRLTAPVDHIKNALNCIVRDWFMYRGTDHSRPLSLLTSRTFLVRPDVNQGFDYEDDKDDDFMSASWNDIDMLLIQGRLSLRHSPLEFHQYMDRNQTDTVSEDLLRKHCWRFHQRETMRLHEAKGVEQRCAPKHDYQEEAVEIKLGGLCGGCYVADTSEIGSLLFYLRQALVYKFGLTQQTQVNTSIILPQRHTCVHNNESWHMTPQTSNIWLRRLTDAQRAKIAKYDPEQLRKAEMYLDYVECQVW